MRQISHTLRSKQEGVTGIPYVLVSVQTDPVKNYDNAVGGRVVSVVGFENPYSEHVEILLDNSDQTFKALDLTGEQVLLGWGFETT